MENQNSILEGKTTSIELKETKNSLYKNILQFLYRNKKQLVAIYLLSRILVALPEFLGNINSGMNIKKSAGYAISTIPDKLIPGDQGVWTYQIIAMLNAIDDCNDLGINCDIPTAIEIILNEPTFGQGLSTYSLYTSSSDKILELSYKDPVKRTAEKIMNFNQLSDDINFETNIDLYLIQKVENEVNGRISKVEDIDSMRSLFISIVVFYLKSENYQTVDKDSIDSAIEYIRNLYSVKQPTNLLEVIVSKSGNDYEKVSHASDLIGYVGKSENFKFLLENVPEYLKSPIEENWDLLEYSLRMYFANNEDYRSEWSMTLEEYLSMHISLYNTGYTPNQIAIFTESIHNLVSIGLVKEDSVDEFLGGDFFNLNLRVFGTGYSLPSNFEPGKSIDELNFKAPRYLNFLDQNPLIKVSIVMEFVNILDDSTSLSDDEISYFLNRLSDRYIWQLLLTLDYFNPEQRESVLLAIEKLKSVYGEHTVLIFSKGVTHLHQNGFNNPESVENVVKYLTQDIPNHIQLNLFSAKSWEGEDYDTFIGEIIRGNMDTLSEESFTRLLKDLQSKELLRNKGNKAEMDFISVIDTYYILNLDFFAKSNIPLGNFYDEEILSYHSIFWDIYKSKDVSVEAMLKIFSFYQYKYNFKDTLFKNGKIDSEELVLFKNIIEIYSEFSKNNINLLWGLDDYIYDTTDPNELFNFLNSESIRIPESGSVFYSLYTLFQNEYSFSEIETFISENNIDPKILRYIAFHTEYIPSNLNDLAETIKGASNSIEFLKSFNNQLLNQDISNTIFNSSMHLYMNNSIGRYIFTDFIDIPNAIEIKNGVVLINKGSSEIYLTLDVDSQTIKSTEDSGSIISLNSLIYNGAGDNMIHLTSEGKTSVDFSVINIENFRQNYSGRSFIARTEDGFLKVLSSDDMISLWEETSANNLNEFIEIMKFNILLNALPEIQMNNNEIHLRHNPTTLRFSVQDRTYVVIGNNGKAYVVAIMGGINITEGLFREICNTLGIKTATAFISDLGVSSRIYTNSTLYNLGAADFNSAPQFLIHFSDVK